MVAYVVAEIDVKDAAEYENYKTPAFASIAQYGGRYLTRGGKAELLEGEPSPSRVVVLEFPSFEQATRWYHSPEYQAAAQIRRRCATGRLYAVEGL